MQSLQRVSSEPGGPPPGFLRSERFSARIPSIGAVYPGSADAIKLIPMTSLNPARTTWHITFGTYGARLHGDERPTVDRRQNQPGQPFFGQDPGRRAAEEMQMRASMVLLTCEQRRLVEVRLSEICDRGGWGCRTCAAGGDHVHLLCDAPPNVHGRQIRTLVKRWLTQALDREWKRPPSGRWWADGGSCKPIKNAEYLGNVCGYIRRQRLSR